ncbi:MAG: bifunctional 2-C-methyl-D-erythritol 4-phosphate cytidylyltransferase/2-C-methyl-D-erythritol 2,4-cyclodiphosphate synthase [Pseudomonadota bacterium]
MKVAAVIVAAGRGRRMGGPVPKQYQRIAGQMVLRRTLDAALACPRITTVLTAITEDCRSLYEEATLGLDDTRLASPVPGGAERADTVRLALEALADAGPDIVLVHDAARPFASPTLWEALIDAASGTEGAIAAEPVVDALWAEGTGAAAPMGCCDEPRPRAGLWRAQTPQAFPYAALLAAHRTEATSEAPSALDDAEVFRRAGGTVRLVPGEPDNFKITTPADLARAERLVAEKEPPMDVRTGHGFDVHRFGPGDHVMLCGVAVPHSHGLVGHSDADVGLHALADAIYGALAEGDIGTHFPPSDPQWKGAESHVFLAHAGARVAARGGRISNLDVTLLCERPKIGPHSAAMRTEIGRILGLDPGRIGLKATTMERMGFIGREEGMGCIATATVILPASTGSDAE